MYLFCTTRHGVSGKELQRQLGVTYKTAYRIGQQIRDLTSKAQGFDAMLAGHIELDEAYVGGRRSGGKRGRGAPGKTIVMGLAQRGGRMKAVVIPDVKKDTLRDVVLANVEPGFHRLDGLTLQLQLTHRRRLHAWHREARQEGIRALRLPERRDVPRQHRRRLLEAVQGFGSVNSHPDQRQAYAALSRRVHFPRDAPASRERDV
jgi:hypothetical protein